MSARRKKAPSRSSAIEQLRRRIDEIDARLVGLLNRRAELAGGIGRAKQHTDGPIYAPGREKAVYRRVLERNGGPLPDESLLAVFREIMSASILMERKLVIAYLGPAATFSHQAALGKFGQCVDYLPTPNIADIFSQVERRNADYGIVPVENSLEGAVNPTADALMDTALNVYAEVDQEIEHHLISHGQLSGIRRVYTNPSVFGQCRRWLLDNLPKATLVETASTAQAVRQVRNRASCAAIGCRLASEIYGVPVLRRSIQDFARNVTRFLVLALHDAPPTGDDKTSVIFSLKDRVGVLFDSLKTFKDSGINLTRIESRPSKKRPWEYCFFVDFAGHRLDPKVRAALARLEKHCQMLKILGSYPRYHRGR